MLVDFFDRLYSSIIGRNVFLNKIRFYSVLRFLIRSVANVVIPVYFKLTKHNPAYALDEVNKTHGRLIVSLTSFPARINKIWLVIETILRQTQKPDMMILWLSKEQFATKNMLPKNLLNLQERGLKIELRNGDLRSHKKYYYTLTEYPEDILITVDDDMFYRSELIETLWNYSMDYPHCVISNYAHKMIWKNENLMPYKEWGTNRDSCGSRGSNDIFFGSGGGTLFPIAALDSHVLEEKVFMDICKNADDVWLNAMCRMKGTQIVRTNYYSANLLISIKNKMSLASLNIDVGNDVQINGVRKYCESLIPGWDVFGE